jgi:hypothetical protein
MRRNSLASRARRADLRKVIRILKRIGKGNAPSFVLAHCLILGFATEYSKSVRKFTAT